MSSWLKAIALSTVAVFAPIEGLLATAFLLIILDLITGIMAARKKGIPITSSGLKRTVGKIFLYECVIAVGFLVRRYCTGDLLPLDHLVGCIVALTEGTSVLENMTVLTGNPIFATLLNKVVAAEAKEDAVKR